MEDEPTVTPNDAVAFLVEVAALLVLGVWGWRHGDGTVARVSSAVGLPLVAALLWGAFAAPRSRVDVLALELATKAVVLGGALWAARELLAPGLWWAAAVVVVVNTVLSYVGPWSR